MIKDNLVKRIFDNFIECVVLLFNGSLFQHVNDVVFIFSYVSPENSPIYDENDNNGIDILNININNIIAEYPNTDLFLSGDLNSRIKDFKDFIPDDDISFIFGNDVDYPSDNFTIPRNSKDEKYNRFGLSLIELCCTYDVHTLNGRLFSDIDGNFTCFANNGASIVDYMIASSSLFKYITDFRIGDKDSSVHFPLHCQLCFKSVSYNQSSYNIDTSTLRTWKKHKWKDELKDIFYEKFCAYFRCFNEKISNRNDRPLSTYISDFIDVFNNAGDMMKIKHFNRYNSTQPLWWDRDCNASKVDKSRALRHFRRTNDIQDLITYKTKRNRFKSICLNKKALLSKKKRNELVSSRKNAKVFWKTLKGNSKNQNTDVTPEKWYDYFKSLFTAGENKNFEQNDNIFENGISLIFI